MIARAQLRDEAVGVGSGGRYLPERQAEALRQQLACDDGILPGSMVVRPFAPCSASARAIDAGEWPNMLPVSPRQKST